MAAMPRGLMRHTRKRMKAGSNLGNPVEFKNHMQAEPMNKDSVFGEPIYSYTRAQALADGVLVDVTGAAREAGFRVPTAMTAAAWLKTVAWRHADCKRKPTQDEAGRLWDVVWLGLIAARGAQGRSRVAYQLCVVPSDGAETQPRLTTLHLVIGPGDEGEPVVTIMNPAED